MKLLEEHNIKIKILNGNKTIKYKYIRTGFEKFQLFTTKFQAVFMKVNFHFSP